MNYDATKLEEKDRILLFKIDKKERAYKDQYNVFHTAWVVLEEVWVSIIERRIVDGDYNHDLKAIGYKAVSGVGEEFFQNWEYFPMTSHSPYHYWYKECGNDDYEEYVNSDMEVGKFFFEHTALLNRKNSSLEPGECRMPLIRENGEFIPSEYEYCKKHYNAYHKGEECLKCSSK